MVAFDRDRSTVPIAPAAASSTSETTTSTTTTSSTSTITTTISFTTTVIYTTGGSNDPSFFIKFCQFARHHRSFGLGASAEHARKVAKAKPDCVLRVASTNSATETLIETEMEQRRCACHRHSNTVRDLKCPRLLGAPGVGGVKRNKSCGRASAAAGARASGLAREGGAYVRGRGIA